MQKFNKVNQHENILDCRVDCRNNFDPSLHIFNSFFRFKSTTVSFYPLNLSKLSNQIYSY